MTRVRFTLIVAGLALAGCSDMFAPPPLPDLSKEPYDFAVEVPPFTGPGADLAKSGPKDMAVHVPPPD